MGDEVSDSGKCGRLSNVVCGSQIILEVACVSDEYKSSVCGLQLVLEFAYGV